MPDLAHEALNWQPFSDVHAVVAAHMKLSAVLFGVALPDYAMTCLVAVLERRPRLLLLGLFFPLLRIVDAAIALSASSGRLACPVERDLAEPARRALEPPGEPGGGNRARATGQPRARPGRERQPGRER